jgi:hypothetical protein
MKMKISKNQLVILVLCLLFVSCSEPEPETPSPEEIVIQSAERMSGLPGFQFTIQNSGADVILDEASALALGQAVGYYSAPDKAQAEVNVLTPGFATSVNVISIGDMQWQTNPLTAQWAELPPQWGFNPAALFDGETGIQSILISDLSELELIGAENLEEGPVEELFSISGNLDGSGLVELTQGLIGSESMTVRLWIAPESYELHRAIITDPNIGGDEPIVWQVDFSQFGFAPEIKPPVVQGT